MNDSSFVLLYEKGENFNMEKVLTPFKSYPNCNYSQRFCDAMDMNLICEYLIFT